MASASPSSGKLLARMRWTDGQTDGQTDRRMRCAGLWPLLACLHAWDDLLLTYWVLFECSSGVWYASAPNYCDQMGNQGAFITLKEDLVPQYTQFSAVVSHDGCAGEHVVLCAVSTCRNAACCTHILSLVQRNISRSDSCSALLKHCSVCTSLALPRSHTRTSR